MLKYLNISAYSIFQDTISVHILFQGQTIAVPTMQTMKKLVSVKSTDRKPLPPLRSANNLPPISHPLSSPSASIAKQPLPSITKPTDVPHSSSSNSRTQDDTISQSSRVNSPSHNLQISEDTAEATAKHTPSPATGSGNGHLFQTSSAHSSSLQNPDPSELHRVAADNLKNEVRIYCHTMHIHLIGILYMELF